MLSMKENTLWHKKDNVFSSGEQSLKINGAKILGGTPKELGCGRRGGRGGYSKQPNLFGNNSTNNLQGLAENVVYCVNSTTDQSY